MATKEAYDMATSKAGRRRLAKQKGQECCPRVSTLDDLILDIVRMAASKGERGVTIGALLITLQPSSEDFLRACGELAQRGLVNLHRPSSRLVLTSAGRELFERYVQARLAEPGSLSEWIIRNVLVSRCEPIRRA